MYGILKFNPSVKLLSIIFPNLTLKPTSPLLMVVKLLNIVININN